MARSRLMIGSVCLLLSGMCMARQQGRVRTGISARPQQTTNAPAAAPAVKPGTVMNSGRPGQVTTAPMQSAPANMQQQQQFVGPPSPVPPPPQRPEQMPPVPAKVSYQNGLLTIQAPNSTLGDIFNGIRSRAGIQFEGGQGAGDRVALTIGPAPADEVLRALLTGSRFDYVILGDPSNPDLVQRVILTPRTGGSANAVTASIPPQARPQQGSEEDDEDQPPAETVQPPPPVQPPPIQAPQQAGDSPKTTQQLLEELKQMQQQQQQQAQQPVNPNSPDPAPLKQGAPQQGAPMIRPKMPPM